MKMRRLLACIMALLLSTSLPVSALADTYDLAEGSVSVNASESGQTVTHKEETRSDSAPVITQSGGGTTANTVTIEAGSGSTANVTLKDVNISADGAAVEIKGSGDVTIELDGKNTVQSGEGHAGVEKNNKGSLTITDKNDNPGSLEATGGAGGSGIGGGAKGTDSDIATSGGTAESSGVMGGVGIGGEGGSGSNIVISGGTAESSGGMGGVGIGGGEGGNGSNIAISGGTVEATGGGEGGNGSNIPISSGTVAARGGTGGSSIGGGVSGDGSGIYISGGSVTAKGGENAAGIGGGVNGNGSDIVISGGRVETTGGDAPNKGSGDKIEIGVGGGAGIGGGANGTGSDIFIKDDAVVTATGKGNAADIGNGNSIDATEKQANNVNVDEVYTTGSVNGKPGTKEPPKKNDNGQSSGGGYTVNIPSDIRVPGSSSGNMESWIYASGYIEKDSFLKVRILGQNGQNLPSELKMEKNQLTITAPAVNVTVSGCRDDLNRLNDQGIDQINLETNRVSVSVSNDLLMKITNADESFQLSTEGTGVSLTTTDKNHKKIFDMNLTTGGTQEEQQIGNGTHEKQQETPKNTNGQLVYKIDVRLPNDDPLNSSLHLISPSENATLTSTVGSLQTLIDRGIDGTLLSTNGVTSSIDHKRVLETAKISDSLKLTHNGETVTFTLGNGADIGKILK